MGRPFNRSSWRGRGSSRGSFRGSARARGGSKAKGDRPVLATEREGGREADRVEDATAWDELDETLGFAKYSEGAPRQGWLVNMQATVEPDDTGLSSKAAVDYYFIQDDGAMFKSTVAYEPYFFLACRRGQEGNVEEWLVRKYEDLITRVQRQRKEDLKLPNHLLGHRRVYLQLFFKNQTDLFAVRRDLLPLANKNRDKLDAVDTYAEVVNAGPKSRVGFADIEDGFGAASASFAEEFGHEAEASTGDPADAIIDIREYDVPYYLRVAIDKDIRVGLWYTVTAEHGQIKLELIKERVSRAEPVVMAYDIETTKAPLKFPDQQHDQVMMISYMIDGQGFLITNREIVSADVEDFEYSPTTEYEGLFTVFNEPDEASTIRRFFEHFKDARPTVMATYNGDSFDFPFLLARATLHGIDMYKETGFTKDNDEEFKSRACVHMDCFRWVKRDSYLPQGSQGLKAVTVAKLGYNPIELDPELMTPYAMEKPQSLAQYSVSDAVATYYLYMKYVHPFIFSLCNIIPLNPDEVLRKGSGTLCETLLMVEAFRSEVIMPNRHIENHTAMYEGHLLESETYVGGHVEALEAGVFRSDVPADFKIVPSAIDGLLEDLDAALKFAIVEEGKKSMDDIADYDEVKASIAAMLVDLREQPLRQDTPLIYHLDVAAMYPNIMLSNRLQPDSVVDEAMCAACDYNRPGKTCDRRLEWAWRGEFFPAKLDEYKMVRNALEQESFPSKRPNAPPRRFIDLSPSEQTSLIHKRLGDYSRKVYKKAKETKIEKKESIICQRENPFYIDTVRTFRDRRYTYKGLHKTWKKNLDEAVGGGSLPEIVDAKKMIVLYDSLQLAHKCILNSFYGYVMRKGARWHSMEMAGITCLTGASIIQMARKLVEQIGRPLELDTDGIWCMLPSTFPDNISFKIKSGKTFDISYPCTILNYLVHKDFTNHQYHELVDPSRGKYEIRSENSIFFELDGPYRAMILPSSKEEDKLLKKRYAVFNDDGSLAELKGFEVKRRGELQLIKIFQSQIFEKFLLGANLQECYAAVAAVADKWLDVLTTKAACMPDDELVDLIAENRSMSKTLAEYGGQKSTSISTAKRLAEFLGEQMVRDKGISCRFIISSKPQGAPVTERAIPVAIFSSELSIKRHFLRKWLRDNSLATFDLRSILDWDYYVERLGSVIQKLITIPAALQRISNPVPRIRHPDWLFRRVANLEDKFKQHKLSDMFARQAARAPATALLEGLAANETAAPKELAVERASPVPTSPPPPPPPPDIRKDYPGWLAHMKPIWRERRREFQQAARSGVALHGGRLTSMLSARSGLLSSHIWEILQIAPIAERPGEFRMWLLIQDTFQSVRLRVPREFYVNSPDEAFDQAGWPAEATVEQRVRTLPRSQTMLNLFRVQTPEEDFVKKHHLYAELLNRPGVDGVYELQVPLLVRAYLAYGNTVVPRSQKGVTLNKGLDQHFDLDDLSKPTSLSRRSYLDAGRNVNFMYLYHANCDSRHIFGLFHPDGKLKVWVVEKGRAREVPNLAKVYHNLVEGSPQWMKDGPLLYPASLSVEVAYVGQDDAALRAISRELVVGTSGRSRPSLLVCQSPKSRSYFESRVTNLARMPFFVLQSSRSDNTFPALLWQGPACRRMLRCYVWSARWVKGRIALADKFDMPLCNLEGDLPLMLSDLDLARRLSKADFLLWWSPGVRPDLGGRETDANSQQTTEELVSPEISRPGCFSNASLELDLRNLAVNAVLQAALVYDLEGADGAASIGFESAAHSLREYAKGTAHAAVALGETLLPTGTFNVLRSMVRHWATEAEKDEGGHFQLLLDHFWRWTSSTSAQLYDPATHRFVHGLMSKTFSQLLAECKRLGSDVVFADFGRLVLTTGKPNSTSAFAYAHYLVSSLSSRELFKHIHLDIVHFWDLLLWMDAANFGGIRCLRPDLVEVDEPESPSVELSWNVAAFLPAIVRERFAFVIADFVIQMDKIKRESDRGGRTPLRVIQNATHTIPDEHKQDSLELLRKVVSHRLTQTLLTTVKELQDDRADLDKRALFAFPETPGAHLRMTDPILEFIKMVCAALSLAADLRPDVTILKRNLLDMVGVREFAPEAAFRNPCIPFKVPMVVCKSCNLARDLDLTRDPDLLSNSWKCERCDTDYDKIAIETRVIESLHRRLIGYQLQDLRCSRCKQMKADSMNRLCDCSAPFEATVSRAEIVRHLQLTTRVAAYHSLGFLLSFCEDQKHLLSV